MWNNIRFHHWYISTTQHLVLILLCAEHLVMLSLWTVLNLILTVAVIRRAHFHTYIRNKSTKLVYFCLLLLAVTIFISHLVPPCEISEGIYFMSLCFASSFVRLSASLFWPLTLYEKSNCNITVTPEINLVFSITKIIVKPLESILCCMTSFAETCTGPCDLNWSDEAASTAADDDWIRIETCIDPCGLNRSDEAASTAADDDCTNIY